MVRGGWGVYWWMNGCVVVERREEDCSDEEAQHTRVGWRDIEMDGKETAELVCFDTTRQILFSLKKNLVRVCVCVCMCVPKVSTCSL